MSRWNLVGCLHPPYISDLLLMRLLLSFFHCLRIAHLSSMHRTQGLVSYVFLQVIELPFHCMSTDICFRTSSLVISFCPLKCWAKCIAKESLWDWLFTSLQTSSTCCSQHLFFTLFWMLPMLHGIFLRDTWKQRETQTNCEMVGDPKGPPGAKRVSQKIAKSMRFGWSTPSSSQHE